jgi:hypothetical protein
VAVADVGAVVATVPVISPPAWAVLQRHLISVIDAAWPDFERRFCLPDGRLDYRGALASRDGVDDFYEPFFNWPTFAMLTGSRDILGASKQHWTGVTRQLTELGMLRDEYERGYDWFHQGEALLFFLGLCAADPGDGAFRDRALRFARIFLPGSPAGVYDGQRRMFRAPHIGAEGPRPGLGDWEDGYGADQPGMRPYGLPLRDIPGIGRWEDLGDPGNARRMGAAMQERLGAGDVPVSLAVTSLVANAWLFGHEASLASWIDEYVGAWRERAAANGGLIPDNVGPSGVVGELHDGRWFGGHYGWTWPHGLHSVGAGALVAAINHALVTGDRSAFDLARTPLETVLSLSVHDRLRPDEATLAGIWRVRLPDPGQPVQLVPYRVDASGWFDWMPVQLTFPIWLWAAGGGPADKRRLDAVRAACGYDWAEMVSFRSKEEAGHEDAWYAWLQGDYPAYPEQSLLMAVGQVARRRALMEQDLGPQGDDIHRWQQLNPVVTEVLVQQIAGSPAPLYNGGLPLMRLRWWDAAAGRPGLPPDVAALVSRVEDAELTVSIVNLSGDTDREVVVQAGTYGEDRIVAVSFDAGDGQWPGGLHAPASGIRRLWRRVPVGRSRVRIRLPHARSIEVRLTIERGAYVPRHTSFRDENEQERA